MEVSEQLKKIRSEEQKHELGYYYEKLDELEIIFERQQDECESHSYYDWACRNYRIHVPSWDDMMNNSSISDMFDRKLDTYFCDIQEMVQDYVKKINELEEDKSEEQIVTPEINTQEHYYDKYLRYETRNLLWILIGSDEVEEIKAIKKILELRENE